MEHCRIWGHQFLLCIQDYTWYFKHHLRKVWWPWIVKWLMKSSVIQDILMNLRMMDHKIHHIWSDYWSIHSVMLARALAGNWCWEAEKETMNLTSWAMESGNSFLTPVALSLCPGTCGMVTSVSQTYAFFKCIIEPKIIQSFFKSSYKSCTLYAGKHATEVNVICVSSLGLQDQAYNI